MEVSTEVERPCPMRTRVGVCHRFPTTGFEGVSTAGEEGGMAGWGGVGATTAAAMSGMEDSIWEGAVGVGGTTVLVVSNFLFLDCREGGREGEKAFSKLCSHLCLIGQCVPGMPITGKTVYRVSTANAGY